MQIVSHLRDQNVNYEKVLYKDLRKGIGIIGVLLPLICIVYGVANRKLEASISGYYYTDARDIFVGILVSVSFFMFAYKGPEVIDRIISFILGISAFGIAVFPCEYVVSIDSGVKYFGSDFVGIFHLTGRTSNFFHYIFGGIFFLTLGLNCIFIFTLRDKNESIIKTGLKNLANFFSGKVFLDIIKILIKKERHDKDKRNSIYTFCGVAILLCCLSFALEELLFHDKHSRIIFIFETIMLLMYGIAWLVKGIKKADNNL